MNTMVLLDYSWDEIISYLATALAHYNSFVRLGLLRCKHWEE